jgi:two-component system nitrogen regulation response regulator NtrX
MARILIIDDEKNILTSLQTFLTIKNHSVYTAQTVMEAEMLVNSANPEVIILDVFLKGDSGIDFLKEVVKKNPHPYVIMISGHADVKTAVYAIKEGAYDFIEKPIDTEKLEILIQNALKQQQLADQVQNLKQNWIKDNFFIGSSTLMRKAIIMAEKAGPTDLSVLITGESGTGKELLANYIHLNSNRTGKPYIRINCAAIQQELFESEIFGHKKGSFTGAINDKPGFFKMAEKGTLFLDEITEIPYYLQAKLLRAIEYKEIQGVGFYKPEHIDVRIISASNQDLKEEIAVKRFREDLFFRLSQVPIQIPSLNERKEDILHLIQRFKGEIEVKMGIEQKTFSSQAIEYLMHREYKGNIRELRNIIERIMLLNESSIISVKNLKEIDNNMDFKNQYQNIFDNTKNFQEAKKDLIKKYIEIQLSKHNNSIKDTANSLGMLANNLSRKIHELGIEISNLE